ncbi:hypothetical protein [Qipengyuania flava]|uniref:hypothetical protein n=1 Tax=Qipengyuania flava TaxID=192812 RepID=UPI003BAF0E7D
MRVQKQGYVGVGRVTGDAVHAKDFLLRGQDGAERPVLEVLTHHPYHRQFADESERTE